jgi:hypothetical protein
MWVQFSDEQATEAKAVLLAAGRADLAQRFEHYEALERDPNTAAFRAGADREARDGELEVDLDDAVVSRGDDPGAYVMCWLWVSNSEAGLPDPDEEAETEEELTDA